MNAGAPELKRIHAAQPRGFAHLRTEEELDNYNVRVLREAATAIGLEWNGATVLDVGCGAKQYMVDHLWSAARFRLGLDLRWESLMANQQVTRIRGDMYCMPLNSRSVDIMVSMHTIEHAAKPSEFLSEIARVLKPGGRAVIVTPNLPGYQAFIAKSVGNVGANLIWKWMIGRSLPFDLYYRCNTVKAMTRQACEAGLELNTVVYVPMVPHFFYRFRLLSVAALAFNYAAERLGLPWLWITMIAELRRN